MQNFKKSKTKNGISRAITFALAIIVQFIWIFTLLLFLTRFYPVISIGASVIAIGVVIGFFSKNMNTTFKLTWSVLLLAFPLFGVIIYFLTGHSSVNKRQIRKFNAVSDRIRLRGEEINREPVNMDSLDLSIANQSRYISEIAHYAPHFGCDVRYYNDAALCFRAMLEDIKKAHKFIFMEYHAIDDCPFFEELVDILEEKVKAGVEVRMIYDDLGSIIFINRDFANDMQARGIKCRVFNPIVPTINVLMNNRDHRKITVVDGKVSYTGGFNLADEYFNLVSPYGHWKDTGVRIEGSATMNLTTLFLEMWNQIANTDKDEEIDAFIRESYYARTFDSKCLTQPYGDTPLDDENVGETIYQNLISAAKKYVWISTPYLICDDETLNTLTLAAKRGVDVRILIPGIPDKKFVYSATKSYAATLAKRGVRIYKYTAGFNHAKQVVCDDEVATCGTVNFDYRSMYYHFENGVLFTNSEAVKSMREDFEDVFEQCEEVTERYKFRKAAGTFLDNLIRFISPLF